jgi:hypothetical protein
MGGAGASRVRGEGMTTRWAWSGAPRTRATRRTWPLQRVVFAAGLEHGRVCLRHARRGRLRHVAEGRSIATCME